MRNIIRPSRSEGEAYFRRQQRKAISPIWFILLVVLVSISMSRWTHHIQTIDANSFLSVLQKNSKAQAPSAIVLLRQQETSSTEISRPLAQWKRRIDRAVNKPQQARSPDLQRFKLKIVKIKEQALMLQDTLVLSAILQEEEQQQQDLTIIKTEAAKREARAIHEAEQLKTEIGKINDQTVDNYSRQSERATQLIPSSKRTLETASSQTWDSTQNTTVRVSKVHFLPILQLGGFSATGSWLQKVHDFLDMDLEMTCEDTGRISFFFVNRPEEKLCLILDWLGFS